MSKKLIVKAEENVPAHAHRARYTLPKFLASSNTISMLRPILEETALSYSYTIYKKRKGSVCVRGCGLFFINQYGKTSHKRFFRILGVYTSRN